MVPTVLVIFVAVTSIAVVIQMGILIALYVSVRKTSTRMETIALDVHRHATPILETTREILTDAAPKLREVTDNLVDASAVVKNQARALNETVNGIVGRARQQVGRADEVITRTMNTAGRVHETVSSPFRQLSSILYAVNIGIGAFLGKKPVRRSGERGGNDEGMFI